MPYADTDFFLALAKKEDWLKEPAQSLLTEHRGHIWTSLVTFVEIAYNAEEYEIDLERTALNILEIADVDVNPSRIFQAYAYIEDGLNVMDAFHAAAAGQEPIISSDHAYGQAGIETILLQPNDPE